MGKIIFEFVCLTFFLLVLIITAIEYYIYGIEPNHLRVIVVVVLAIFINKNEK